ncbi:hypothetical protein ENBRE01_3233 [Enteropsectra breve]|nr:hypothetical protein ENBRE01_3233 [Enteropsectra breve]
MDELAALKMIFGRYLSEQDDVITIKNGFQTYEISKSNMKIIHPGSPYTDIYNYILKDKPQAAAEEIRSYTIETPQDVVRITAEEFHSWLAQCRSMRPKKDEEMSGKEIWLAQKTSEDMLE